MKQDPLVSVLMTAYNRDQYIEEAIKSVLASTYKSFELIVVDDCSLDNTYLKAKAFCQKDKRVHVFKNEQNLGDYANRNKAASLAVGKYLKYLDSDDLLYPHGLQVMVDCMETFPNAGYGVSANGSTVGAYPLILTPNETYVEHFFTKKGDHFNRAPGSAIIKRSAFERVGGFSGKRMIGDYEMWMKLSRTFALVKMPRDLVWDRVHEGQESQSAYAKQYDILKKEVLNEAINHIDCPLSLEEKKQIFKKTKKTQIKQLYFNVLHKLT